jgi:thymidylate synthase
MEIIANTADDLFEQLIKYDNWNDACDNNVALEIINAHLTLTDPTKNTMCDCARKMPIRYAVGELLWYNSRNNRAAAIKPFSKFWENIADDGVHVNSNYGWCIHDKYGIDQWEICKRQLIIDDNTRQAVIHIKEPRDLINNPSKDVNCTLTLQFLLRNNKLDLIVNMRSNDIWLGLPYDVFNFTCMQIQMAMELGVEIGTYYHNVGSLHIYKRDIDKF